MFGAFHIRRAAVLGVLLGLWLGAGTASGGVLIKLATLAPEGSAWHLALQEMAQEWQRVSKNEVRVRIYPGGVVGDERDMLRKMRIGQIQAAALTILGLSDIDKIVGALEMPLFYESQAELDTVRHVLDPDIRAALAAKGFVLLNWGDAGWVYFFSKHRITTPKELKSAKLFAWAGDTTGLRLWKALGFNPVPLATTDILPGLQTGLIDTFDTTPVAALSFQWYQHVKYMTDLRWAPLVGAVVIRKDTWERIPPELQQKLLAAAEQAEARVRKAVLDGESEAIKAMTDRGLTVVHLNAADVRAWHEEFEPAYPQLKGPLMPPAMLDRIMELRRRFRAGKPL